LLVFDGKRLQIRLPLTSIPFIFLTARGERSDQRAGMNLGADDSQDQAVPREHDQADGYSDLAAGVVVSESPCSEEMSGIEPLRHEGS
jgi:hypothetical protein